MNIIGVMNMRNLLIVLIAITLALGACSTTRQKLTPQGNVNFKTAQVYYAQQNIEKAEEFYTKVLADNPDHALSLRRLADLNLHQGSEIAPIDALEYNKTAYELYDRALKIYKSYENPTDQELADIRDMGKRLTNAWVLVYKAGENAYAAKNTQQAKEIFELASTLDPSKPEPLISLKVIYQNDLNDPAKAEAILLQLLEKDPQKLEYLLETGAFYFNQDNYAEAVKYFERAREVSPADIDNLMNLSYAYYEMENYDKALQYTELALNLEPNDISIIDNAKNIAYKKNDNAKAVQYLEQLIELRQDEEDFNLITYLLNEMEDYDRLVTYAKKWYDWDETSKFAVQYIILAAQRKGDTALQKTYSDILKAMP